MDEGRLKILFQKYIDKKISESERSEFYEFAASSGSMKLLRLYAQEYDIPKDFYVELSDDVGRQILTNIFKREESNNETHLTIQKNTSKKGGVYLLRFAAAAVVLLLVGFYYFFVVGRKSSSPNIAIGNKIIKDALPGHSGAILTLSNGKTYLLDTTQNGMITQGIKKSDKEISISNNDDITYATLTTPYGREQKVTLSDGSVAWLNAGSSIRFPTVFKGAERKVEVMGEVYFEVVHNEKQPFIVQAGNDKIQDLGTHFDVNAYNDESFVKTTLLEGSVLIDTHILKPGQEYANGSVKNVDADASVAWVSGFFQFESVDIKTVMRQLSRWYNVRVEYEGIIPTQKFEGEMQRSLKLSQVLELIAGTGIHYTLNGDRLTIRS